MPETKHKSQQSENKSIDPLEDDVRAYHSREWDKHTKMPKHPGKDQYVEEKTWETFYEADLIRKVDEAGKIDELTKLPRRDAWDREISRALTLLEKNEDIDVTVYMLDLDHFKEVNDMMGHPEGDKVIQSGAAVLHGVRTSVRSTDAVVQIDASRLGGEEYGVVVVNRRKSSQRPHIQNINPEKFGNDLRDRFKRTIAANTRVKNQTVSGGYLTIMRDPTTGQLPTLEEIKEDVDIALYNAKETGRDKMVGWKKGMQRHQNAA